MAYTEESREEGLIEKLVDFKRVNKTVKGGRIVTLWSAMGMVVSGLVTVERVN